MATEAYKLAELFQRTAFIRETSYDWTKVREDNKAGRVGSRDYYAKTLHEAAQEACGIDNYIYVELIHVSLFSAWNNVLDWAQSVTGKDVEKLPNADRDAFLEESRNPQMADLADNVNKLEVQSHGSV